MMRTCSSCAQQYSSKLSSCPSCGTDYAPPARTHAPLVIGARPEGKSNDLVREIREAYERSQAYRDKHA